jgi:hypothetical protein
MATATTTFIATPAGTAVATTTFTGTAVAQRVWQVTGGTTAKARMGLVEGGAITWLSPALP